MSAQTQRPVPWWGLAAAGFVLLAVGLEALASAWANSPVPPWAASLAPLAWPRWARMAWWLLVAGAAGAFHVALASCAQRPRPVLAALTVAAFASFGIGAGLGAEWATWH